jgi:SnoaL-like domain
MSADDVMAVQQLAVRYADALSRGDVRSAVEVFAPEGRLETTTTEPSIGHAEIQRTIAEKIDTMDLIFQTVHLGLIVVEGDRARARFPVTEWLRRSQDEQPFLYLAWYEDEAVRLAEGWRFSARRLVPRTFARPDFMTGRLLPLAELTLEV